MRPADKEERLCRRKFLVGVMSVPVLLPTLARAQAAKPNVYVYVQTDAKSSTLGKTLQDKLKGLTVTVFGRFRDFEQEMETKRPDAVVAVPPLLTALKLTPALQGLRGDKDSESYSLLSGAPLADVNGKLIGVFDLLGRTGTQEFVEKLLKTTGMKPVKRVTKMEDLLSLLQFAAADGVLVPTTSVGAITERSRLTLSKRELPDARVGLTAVGIITPTTRDTVVKEFQSLDPETNKALGVERWRPVT